MEPPPLDALARALSTADVTSSRRRLVSGLTGGVAGLAGLSLRDADAKKKKGKGKGKAARAKAAVEVAAPPRTPVPSSR